MNNYVIELLKSCKIAKIPQLMEQQKSFIIKKSTRMDFKIDQCYRLFIKSINKVVDVEIQKVEADKVYCFSPVWENWVNIEDIDMIQEL